MANDVRLGLIEQIQEWNINRLDLFHLSEPNEVNFVPKFALNGSFQSLWNPLMVELSFGHKSGKSLNRSIDMFLWNVVKVTYRARVKCVCVCASRANG